MLKRLLSISAVVGTLLLTGCATPTPMAFSDNANAPIKQNKTLYLMTATLKNAYKPSHQPKVLVTHVEKPNAESKDDRLNFKMDDLGRMETDSPDGNTYLLRMELDGGQYVIRGMTSMSMSFPIMANYFAPLHGQINPTGSGVYYLGHMEATIRERQGNEFKAGPPLPLIDQAVAGASGGTFEVVISDRWAADEALFKNRFPALKDANVEKAILAPFDRAQAQAWWEAH